MSSEVTKTERDQTIKLDVSAKVYPAKDPKQEKGSILAYASAASSERTSSTMTSASPPHRPCGRR